jgi:hypothetical protein
VREDRVAALISTFVSTETELTFVCASAWIAGWASAKGRNFPIGPDIAAIRRFYQSMAEFAATVSALTRRGAKLIGLLDEAVGTGAEFG